MEHGILLYRLIADLVAGAAGEGYSIVMKIDQYMFTKSACFLLLALLLASCGGLGNLPEPTMDANQIYTAVIGTLVQSISQTQAALPQPAIVADSATPVPSSTPLPIPSPLPSPTRYYVYITPYTSTPLFTPGPTGTAFTATVNPAVLAYGCNNLAFIRDTTVPPGTSFKPGETFTKTWKVMNSGTCNWVYQYRLKFLSGSSMDGEPRMLGRIVTVGDWRDISIELNAPAVPGTYSGYWRMADPEGNMFGATLAISIIVEAPANTAIPTSMFTSTPTPTPSPTGPPTATPTDTPTTTSTP